MVDVDEWQVREVVTLLGEHLGDAGSELTVPTGRTLTVKARRRDDAMVNVWVDRRRAPLPRCVAPSLAERGLDAGGVDVVIESHADTAANGLVLTVLETDLPTPPDRAEECRRAAEWLRDHARGPGSVAGSRQRLGYYAERPFVPLAGIADDALGRYLSRTGARYVLVEDRDQLAALERAEGDAVRVLHEVETAGARAWVLERRPAPAPPEP